MQEIPKEELGRLIKKYTSRLERNISRDAERIKKNSEFSKEYETFRNEIISKNSSRYEAKGRFSCV